MQESNLLLDKSLFNCDNFVLRKCSNKRHVPIYLINKLNEKGCINMTEEHAQTYNNIILKIPKVYLYDLTEVLGSEGPPCYDVTYANDSERQADIKRSVYNLFNSRLTDGLIPKQVINEICPYLSLSEISHKLADFFEDAKVRCTIATICIEYDKPDSEKSNTHMCVYNAEDPMQPFRLLSRHITVKTFLRNYEYGGCYWCTGSGLMISSLGTLIRATTRNRYEDNSNISINFSNSNSLCMITNIRFDLLHKRKEPFERNYCTADKYDKLVHKFIDNGRAGSYFHIEKSRPDDIRYKSINPQITTLFLLEERTEIRMAYLDTTSLAINIIGIVLNIKSNQIANHMILSGDGDRLSLVGGSIINHLLSKLLSKNNRAKLMKISGQYLSSRDNTIPLCSGRELQDVALGSMMQLYNDHIIGCTSCTAISEDAFTYIEPTVDIPAAAAKHNSLKPPHKCYPPMPETHNQQINYTSHSKHYHRTHGRNIVHNIPAVSVNTYDAYNYNENYSSIEEIQAGSMPVFVQGEAYSGIENNAQQTYTKRCMHQEELPGACGCAEAPGPYNNVSIDKSKGAYSKGEYRTSTIQHIEDQTDSSSLCTSSLCSLNEEPLDLEYQPSTRILPAENTKITTKGPHVKGICLPLDEMHKVKQVQTNAQVHIPDVLSQRNASTTKILKSSTKGNTLEEDQVLSSEEIDNQLENDHLVKEGNQSDHLVKEGNQSDHLVKEGNQSDHLVESDSDQLDDNYLPNESNENTRLLEKHSNQFEEKYNNLAKKKAACRRTTKEKKKKKN